MTEEEAKAELQVKFDAVKDSPLMADHLNNHAKMYLESQQGTIIGKAKGEAYGHMDAVLLDVLGLKKEEGTKTTEGLRKQLLKLKTLQESQGQNTDDVEKALKAQKEVHQLDIVKGQQLLKEQLDIVSNMKQEGSKRDITTAVSKALIGAKFLPHYSTKDIEILGDARLNKILSNAKIEGDVIVHYNTDGTKRTKNLLPMTTKEVVIEDYGEMFEVKTPGGGADNNDSSTTVLESGKIVMNMSKVKSKTEFNTLYWKKAAELGKTRQNKEDFKQYGEAMLEYGYKDLPRT